MIHGKTKIELYDVKRNIKQIVKSENTFQNTVLADYFRSYGEEDCNPFRSDSYDGTDLWKNALGGIFLLKNQENVGNKFMSLGNKMVGNGSYGILNNTNPTEMGSYNSSEEVANANSITMVYDYSTAQANDTIRCVCLTSRVGGYIGYGNTSGTYHSSRTYNFQSLQSTRGVVLLNKQTAYGNYVYDVRGDYSDGKLKIVKTRRSLITGSVFDGYSTNIEFDLATVGDAYNLSGHSYSPGCPKLYDIGNGIFRFVPCVGTTDYIGVGGTAYYYEFDAENETLTQKSFTNSSSNKLCYSTRDGDNLIFAFFGDYAICSANNYLASKLEIFNIDTNSHYDTLDATTISGYFGADFRRSYTFILDNNWLAFNIDAGYNRYPVYMYDLSTKTCHPNNMGEVKNPPASIGLFANPSLGSGILDRIEQYPNEDRTKGFVHNPLYLATINNLSSQVNKDATKTMKVIYTLEVI